MRTYESWCFYLLSDFLSIVCRVFQKFVPIVNCILSKAFDTSFGKCKLIQVRNYPNNRSKQFQTKIWRNYNFFKFLPELYTYARFFPPILFLPFCRLSILVFVSFSFIFSIPSWKWRPTLFSDRDQASIFMVFWPFSRKKKGQIVEEVWTMTEDVDKSKDLRKQTKHEWMAVFSQNVWEILSKKL